MSIIDTKAWKEFRLGDLFDVFNGKKYVTHKRTPGSLPLVSNSTADNGIGDFIADRPDNVWSNFISVAYGSGTGIAFYHKQKAFVGETVMALVPKFNMTPSVGIFIAGVLTRYGADTYKYERKPKVDEYRTEVTIMLPAIPDGSPDWAYMEQYMRQIMDKEETFAQHLASLTAEAVADGHKLDTSGWKAFRVGELFEVLLAKGDIQPKQVVDGTIPLVSAGNEDNGIVSFIDAAGDGVSEMFPAGCISVSMFGRVFYQTEAFYAVSHGRINVLKPMRQFSYEQGLFITSCLNRAFVHKFDYATMCTQKKLMSEMISLPATPDGQPDWAYMEEYMRQIMAREQIFADHLASFA